MSLARVYTTQKSRKEWTCSKCGTVLPVRSKVLSFAVGFRGVERKRCGDNPACAPTRAELESSLVASVYDAIDSADVAGAECLEDLEAIRDDIVNACSEVAEEYESNPMYEVNPELQERAEMIRSAGDELEGWSPEEDAPEAEIDCDDCEGTGTISEPEEPDRTCDACDGDGKISNEESRDDWLRDAKESLQDAIDQMELP